MATRQKYDAIHAACDHDAALRAMGEPRIREIMEAHLAAYFSKKRSVWMAAATLLILLWPSLTFAQTTYYLPVPLPEIVRATWDFNPTGTDDFLLEIDGTRVSIGTASTLNPSSTPSPAAMQSLPECNGGCRHYDVVLQANARALLSPEATPRGVRTVKLITATVNYVENGVTTHKESASPAIRVSVGETSPTIPPQPNTPMQFIITGTFTIQAAPGP